MESMKGYRKIIIIVIAGLFLGTSFTSCIGKTTKTTSNSIEGLLEEEEFTTIEIPITQGTKGDPPAGKVWTFGWDPWDLFEVDIFHIAVEYYGKEWEYSRECWEYKFKFMWWYANLCIDGTYSPEPAYLFRADYWPINDYGCWLGESFQYGGYNVQEYTPGDFDPWANVLAHALLQIFNQVTGFPFSNVYTLVDALGSTPEADPTYTWLSECNIWDCSGFFEYDFHVPPDTTFKSSWWFAFGRTGGPWEDGWRLYLDDWHSPPGPAVLELEPEVVDFGDVGVGYSETEEFTLKNTGEASVIIDVLLEGADAQDFDQVSGPIHGIMKPGDEETIGIRFRPTSPGFKSAILKIDADECKDVSANLKGYGKPRSRSVNVIYSNFLKWLAERSLLLEKLLMLTIFKNL